MNPSTNEINPSTNEINPSTNQSFNPINESTNPSIDPSKMEPSQPVRKRGRPKKEKPPESSQPVRKRGRPRKEPPPRSQEDIDDMPPAAAPPFVERLDSTLTNMKGMKDLIKNAKNTVQKFGSALPSLLNEFGPMLADLCDAYVHEKEYHAKVQNANQDFHGTYRVYLRVKPTLGEDGSVVEFTPENDPHSVTAPSLGATSEFGKLNGVFAKHESQAQVFEKLQPLVRRVVEGSNVCFLAYGQSGSGKTFSLFGPSNKGILSDKNGGICQLAIGEIMKLAVGWNFEFSMEEVKGKEVVYLSEPAMVNDFEDVISRLQEGFKDRACSPTNLNQQSSRSHCIVKLKLQRKDANETICGGRLYMVDLAGTEKVKQSKVEGSHLKTSSKINTSLFQLSMVMQALSKKADFVPYSSAVLTSHLKECLDRNSKVVLLAHVSPLEEFYNETTETLDFAKTTAQVRNGVLESLDRDAERLELLIKKHTRKKL